ncbi:MAG TPA: SprT family zinc-dependent metalloprotease [Candidatus Saccharibacteria bacterium]|nr:SprT family zinc-dependent metalloprotease [Candidatus Saccharibacteria bacterium]
MKNTFDYGKYSYEYYIEFSERKSLSLIVRPDLRIIVRAPRDATLNEIETFLTKKWRWLDKQLFEFKKYYKKTHEQQYVAGESYYYLGRQYMLLVDKSTDNMVKLEHGKLRIYTTKSETNSEHNKQLLEEWFERRRNVVFKQEYIRAVKLFDYKKMPQLRTRAMARRWGSYTADNKVFLNPKLIQAPREAIFYVCVHELCHVTNKKHDEAFYKEIEKRIPNWREIKERLEVRFG